ncbi:MAG: DUF4179 domain-containing protein [Clostridia bacterium]|nr:DUF4179 domain-containing protein [Clostridia bacterium]
MKKHLNKYWQDMDSLHYTQEQKSRLASAAIHIAEMEEQQQTRKRRPMRRIALVMAAALAILIGTASATGALKSLAEIFSPVWGSSEEQIELMGAMGQAIGVSDTDNGITITADGVIGDKYNTCIVYTIAWDNNKDFPLPEDWQENPDTHLLNFVSDDIDLSASHGLSGMTWFTDHDPTDNEIQYCQTFSGDIELPLGNTTATFENLQYMSTNNAEPAIVFEGNWKLNFDIDYLDSSISLGKEQSFSYDGLNDEKVTVKDVTLSPVGIHIGYELPSDILEKTYHESYSVDERMSEIPITLTKTDGTVLNLTKQCGYTVWRDQAERVRSKSGTFNEIIPLDDMATLTIGDISYDIPHN